MTKCLFCPNPSDSKEDLFPRWVLRKVKTRQPMVRQIGEAPPSITEDQEVRVPCVCRTCNNNWMSRRENKARTLIGSLLEDLSVTLDSDDQTRLAAWALKTAMVADAAREGGAQFYRAEECEALRKHRAIPKGTGIWIGRFTGRSLSTKTGGTTVNLPDGTLIANFYVFTMAVGHLVFQVLSIHEIARDDITQINLAATDWPWGDLLVQIYPQTSHKVAWPPKYSFSLYSKYPYASLVYRWAGKEGHNVTILAPKAQPLE